jgi:kynurenine formamidase
MVPYTVAGMTPQPIEPPGPPAAGASGRVVDLSHPVVDGMTTYPGLPGPRMRPHLTREQSRPHYTGSTEFQIDEITMVGNTGTYLDSPFHRYPDGTDLAGLPLERLVNLPAVVLHGAAAAGRGIGADRLAGMPVTGRAVLLHTGWDSRWGTAEYGDPAPFVTAAAARWLVDNGAVLVGIDSVNIDDVADGERPAHSILLAAGIPVVEHLTGLDRLPASGARLHAAPPPVTGFGTFPVRAYAIVPADPPADHQAPGSPS